MVLESKHHFFFCCKTTENDLKKVSSICSKLKNQTYFAHTCGREFKLHRRWFLQKPEPEFWPAVNVHPAFCKASPGVSPTLMHSLWGLKLVHKWSRQRSQLVVKSARQREKCVKILFAKATGGAGLCAGCPENCRSPPQWSCSARILQLLL